MDWQWISNTPVDGDGQTEGRLGWQRTDCLFEMQPAKLKCSPPNCDAHGCMKMQSGLHEAPKTALSLALMKPVFNLHAKYSEAQKKTEIPGMEYIYLDQHPEFETKWTKANSGQAKLQGISPEGLNKFTDYRDRCKKGREHSRWCIPVEHEVLAAVCIKEMITQSTHEEWLADYGRNK